MREDSAAERTHQIKMSKGRRPWIPRQLRTLTAFDWLRGSPSWREKLVKSPNLASRRRGVSDRPRPRASGEAPHVPEHDAGVAAGGITARSWRVSWWIPEPHERRVRPSIGAHQGGSSTSSGHRLEDPNAPRPDEEGAPLLTMDAAIRELCERVRLRLDRLKGEHPRAAPPRPSPRGLSPRETHALTPAAPPIDRAGRTWNGRDAELDAELSSVEYDINGAEFLLKEIRAKLATSSTRNLPPVAAYRASLESSRRALAAIRGAGANETRAHGARGG